MFQVHHWPESPGAMISPLQFDVLFLTVFSPLFLQVVALSSWCLLRDSIYYTLSVVALIVVSV